jgi:hypothetical protein
MLDRAIIYAKENPIIGLPKIAALIFDKRRFISVGYNSFCTHPLQAKFTTHPDRIHLHAEIAAIAREKIDVEGMDMYIARVWKNGKPALAKPCKGCQSALAAFKLKNIYWTE